jgi:hypothetical protein
MVISLSFQGLVPQTLLETLYYSGIICMAVKDLPRAASYFRMVWCTLPNATPVFRPFPALIDRQQPC